MKLTKDLENIILDHGTGGLLSHDLISSIITAKLEDEKKKKMEDSAILEVSSRRLAMTTDSFVIDPIFFGEGNIGKVAVCGTVNDLAVSGAKPLYLSLALVLEEGFPIKDLEEILDSIRETAKEAGVYIVAGDTKVVKKGEVDKIFINTTGIGVFEGDVSPFSVNSIQEGDDIIITGQLGNHSIHILSIREGLGFEQRINSDCAPLNHMISELKNHFGDSIHCMRDITRGGLGTVLNEVSETINTGIKIQERDIPMLAETIMAADMLGVNPMYLANEGNVCMFVSPEVSEEVVRVLKNTKYGKEAAVIGKVTQTKERQVLMEAKSGELKLIELLYGAELPRLC